MISEYAGVILGDEQLEPQNYAAAERDLITDQAGLYVTSFIITKDKCAAL